MAVMTMIDDGEEKEKKQKTDRQTGQPVVSVQGSRGTASVEAQSGKDISTQSVQYSTHTQAASFCTTDFANRRH